MQKYNFSNVSQERGGLDTENAFKRDNSNESLYIAPSESGHDQFVFDREPMGYGGIINLMRPPPKLSPRGTQQYNFESTTGIGSYRVTPHIITQQSPFKNAAASNLNLTDTNKLTKQSAKAYVNQIKYQ